MQAQFMIDQSLAKNLIDFFGNQWLETYSSYNYYTAQEASSTIVTHIETMLKQGFETSWSLGGTSNNCWGDSSTFSSELEPELPYIDEFLLEFYPTIGFLQYKMVTKSITRTSSSSSDYYGGSSQNATKCLHFSDFSRALIKTKVITDPEVVSISQLNDYMVEQFSVEKLSSLFKSKVSKKTKK